MGRVQVEGTELAVRLAGDRNNPALLLFHGISSSSESVREVVQCAALMRDFIRRVEQVPETPDVTRKERRVMLHRSGCTSRRIIALVAPFLIGCSEPDWTRVVGSLSVDFDRVVDVRAPARVGAREVFVVTVVTIGSSYCIRPDGNDLTVSASLARLIPYDEVPGDGRDCARDAIPVPHTVALRFDQPGTAVLRVVGMFQLPEPAALDSVDFEIEVR